MGLYSPHGGGCRTSGACQRKDSDGETVSSCAEPLYVGNSCREERQRGRGFSSLREAGIAGGNGLQQCKLGVLTLCEYYGGFFR